MEGVIKLSVCLAVCTGAGSLSCGPGLVKKEQSLCTLVILVWM